MIHTFGCHQVPVNFKNGTFTSGWKTSSIAGKWVATGVKGVLPLHFPLAFLWTTCPERAPVCSAHFQVLTERECRFSSQHISPVVIGRATQDLQMWASAISNAGRALVWSTECLSLPWLFSTGKKSHREADRCLLSK